MKISLLIVSLIISLLSFTQNVNSNVDEIDRDILNYFKARSANASAESFNAKIKTSDYKVEG
ncbi:transposase [Chryseobacterium luteum]|uniref:Transposase IS204/IS1001/IS1096/IS1165 DDE domain-containing protein n=1 Tax=Chryseobacterium luteum TaxID=421531 RepID=A0A085ZWK3_9FLAO|nr:transposase [Chryseobacterium luteum]KFF08817.1 hypothetical protein IX38_05150 [Chryseobacterium luteum]